MTPAVPARRPRTGNAPAGPARQERSDSELGYASYGRTARRRNTEPAVLLLLQHRSAATALGCPAKLAELHDGLNDGMVTNASYTVAQAVKDWLADGLAGRAPKTVGSQLATSAVCSARPA